MLAIKLSAIYFALLSLSLLFIFFRGHTQIACKAVLEVVSERILAEKTTRIPEISRWVIVSYTCTLLEMLTVALKIFSERSGYFLKENNNIQENSIWKN
jgi:hypothetical protein